ncbi:hypothetical protein KIN20_026386 [Parelaphostrongylus tenuis]|uniref:protein-serine/threonine phosphatase n=1 Tax=Parelaphostrongylus tenuis TaxID=148309 RepID=A0AAD5QXZ0_PARTN|nr:hypothetical protein KIN20_026386 [Parelaphostrongylus tenuis]
MSAKKQKYHIDRQTRKIYENRSESDMYCSRSCMLRSAAVRAQLPDEPLWLTGNIEKRICSSYCVDTPIDLKHTTAEKTVIEIVRAVEDKLSDLIIREAESSSASEAEEEEENQTDVEEYLNEVSDIIGVKEDLEIKSNQGTRSSKASDSGSGDMSIEMEATKLRSDVSHSLNGKSVERNKRSTSESTTS